MNHQPFSVVRADAACAPFLVILFSLAALPGIAQPDIAMPDDVEERIERAVGQYESEEDADILDELEKYQSRPIDLHTATAEMLASLPGISLAEAKAILEFIDRTSPEEFADFEAVEGLTAGQIDVLRTFTSLHARGRPRPQARLRVEVRSRFTQDLQPRRGYGDALRRIVPRLDNATGDSTGLDTIVIGSSYLGGRAGYMTRVIVSHGDISAGITFEKDPGEPLLFRDTASLAYQQLEYAGPRRPPGEIRERIGFFLGMHAALPLGPMTIHLGDYTAEFGQGLVVRNGFGGSKGAEVVRAPYRMGRGVRSYRSPGESDFLRGGAVTFEEGGWLPQGMSASIILSWRSLDGSLEEGEDSSIQVTSLREDGYRRTRGEIRRSGNLDERLIGLHAAYRSQSGRIGLTLYNARFSIPFSADSPGDFAGAAVTMAGIDGEWRMGGTTIFGEIARDHNGTCGGLGGVITTIAGAELALAGRYLPPGFHTPHGTGFGESPKGQRNEQGLYIGLKGRLTPALLLSTYFDLYHHPERSATIPFPRSGTDGFLQVDYAPVRAITLYARLRSEAKDDAFTITDTLDRERKRMVDRSSTSGRLEAGYRSPEGAIRLRGRFERRYVSYGGALPASDGILTFIDLRWALTRTLSLGTRLALFDTDNHDAAIHELEQDLPGRLTNLPLSGEGRRYYLYLRWALTPALSLAARYAETVYADRATISPGGPQEIDGPVNNMLAVQMDLRF